MFWCYHAVCNLASINANGMMKKRMTAQNLHSQKNKTMQIGKYTCRLGILQIKQMLDDIYHPERTIWYF